MHRINREKPYNDLPLLPPAADLETVAVLKAVTRASRALAELKGRTYTLPNPAILLNTIALQEARASSEIENLFTTNDELYRGLSSDDADVSPSTKDVLVYWVRWSKEGFSTIEKIGFDDLGRPLGSWPRGVFTEDVAQARRLLQIQKGKSLEQ